MKLFKTLLAASALSLAAITPGLSMAAPAASADYAVGPQYDTTHVYVPADQFDAFVTSFSATFGGTVSKQGEFQVTPTPSLTKSQLVLTPAGTVSVFGFKTEIPYPFGAERNGYLVSDMDQAVTDAVKHGATRLITTFPDPIGRDAVVQWPGGVNMQLYWHTAKPNYTPLVTVPENRVYLTSDAADAFVKSWVSYAHGKVTADQRNAPGDEVGKTGKTIRRISIESGYGKMLVIVSDGQLPWPYGRDMSGYQVSDLAATLNRATTAGAKLLVAPHAGADRQTAMVSFPGGYIAEIHQSAAR